MRHRGAADAVERELEAVAGQFGHARQHGVVRRHRGGQFEHGALARQEGVDVAAQHIGVDVQEAVGVADRARQAELGGVGDDGGGGVETGRRSPAAVPAADVGLAERRAAEQQLVAEQRLVAVQHGLAAQVEITHPQGMVGMILARGIGHLGLFGSLYTGYFTAFRPPSGF
jgi:hypothetical protein